jgi:membrane protease YdiL (CAAX protease family)
MIKRFTNSKPITKFFMLLAVFIVMQIVCGCVISIDVIANGMNPNNVNMNLVLIVSALSWGVIVLIYNALFEKKEIYEKTFSFKSPWWYLLVVIGLFVAIYPLMSNIEVFNSNWKIGGSGFMNKISSQSSMIQTGQIIKGTSVMDLFETLIIFCLLPPIFEEWFFRGTLQRIFISWTKNAYIGIILTSLCFAILHTNPQVVLGIFCLSIILGLLYYYTDNLWLNIIFHFLNNLPLVVLTWLSNRGAIDKDWNNGEYVSWYLVAVSIIAIVVWIVWSEKRKRIINVENK